MEFPKVKSVSISLVHGWYDCMYFTTYWSLQSTYTEIIKIGKIQVSYEDFSIKYLIRETLIFLW